MYKRFTFVLAVLNGILGIALLACYFQRGWLSLQNAYFLFSILQSVAVVVSLVFILLQLEQQSRQLEQQSKQLEQQSNLARATNSQSLVATSSNFVLMVATNQVLLDLYRTGGENYSTLDPSQKAQFRYLIVWWLTFYENVVYQHYCGLLDDEVYDAWKKDMEGFIRRRKPETVWGELQANYSDLFIKDFQALLDATTTKKI
jgi:hypothetical protein